jgi:hypothetical protein
MSFALQQQADGWNQRQLLKLGWSRTLISKLLGGPDEKRFRRAGCCCQRYLYLRGRVEHAMKTPEFAACVERREKRRTAPARRFVVWYKTWREALPAACAGLFSLNRFAKHESCGQEERDEIYRLKDRLVEVLYGAGLCAACWVHLVEQPAKVCWNCDGDGCSRCDYSGEWLPKRTLRFYCFRFVVGEKTYVWHQPDRLVRFRVETTEPDAEWNGVVTEKPVGMTRAELGRAKDLVRWVVESAGSSVGRTAA